MVLETPKYWNAKMTAIPIVGVGVLFLVLYAFGLLEDRSQDQTARPTCRCNQCVVLVPCDRVKNMLASKK